MARQKNRKALKVVDLIDCLSNELRVRVWQTINKLREDFSSDREALTWAVRYMEAARQDALPPVSRLGRSKEAVRKGVAESKGAMSSSPRDSQASQGEEDSTN